MPSVTETLLAWGVVPVAVTRFCPAPGVPTVGGTKNPDVAAVVDLAPDLVVMDREENRLEDAEAFSSAGLEVHATNVRSLADVAPTLAALGRAVGVAAGELVDLDALDVLEVPAPASVRAWIPIWRRPWMTISDATYGSSLLAAAGIANVYDGAGDTYPTHSLSDAAGRQPDVVLAPSEPYPFKERHRAQLETVAPVTFVDGQDLFWWGSRTPGALGRWRELAAQFGPPLDNRSGHDAGTTGRTTMSGPLQGVRVIELAGIGPGPFAGMMLSDMGAEVLRVDRAQSVRDNAPAPVHDVLARGRRSIGVDLKQPEGRETVLRLVERADALIEGFRPGVTERLGVGPDDCLARNPRLVYGRMTGWGQEGPYASTAGHDINYIALSGTLAMIGRAGEAPVPPLNLIGDFGGGGMLLAFGVVCGLLEASRSGQGQVIDAAMVDGAALLAAMMHGFRASGMWRDERGTNLLDTGAWYYEVYETADGGYISFGSLEPQFFPEMLRITGLADDVDGRGPVPEQNDRSTWPAMKERMADDRKTKTRDEWCELLEGTDACFAPVLSAGEAPDYPTTRHRHTFIEVAGVVQPAPAPRFSRTRRGGVRPAVRGRSAHGSGPGGLGVQRRRGGGAPGRWRRPLTLRYSRLTTGQVRVRVMPSIICRRLTIIRPNSSTEAASARTITS